MPRGTWTLHQSEIIDWLRAYEGPRFHSVLSDPPYALISIAKRFGPGQAPAQEGSDGRYERVSRGFMGQTWDGWDSLEDYQTWVTEWAKLLIEKALHPGAVCLFFGGTRTFHRLAVGLENGGFEISDATMMPFWVHGQGFPKSHNTANSIDKSLGKPNRGHAIAAGSKRHPTTGLDRPPGENLPPYEARTKQGKPWTGYGTALKPAWEPVLLCRAPRQGKTFAQLAVEFGTGGLNIDGARIGIAAQDDIHAKNPHTHGGFGHAEAEVYGQSDGSDYEVPTGRWPANLVLTHHPECQKVGEVQVPGRTINRFKQGMMPFGNAEGEEYESEQMPDETVERWACVPECQAREVGSASRYFFTGKASRSEKDKGLEDFYWRRGPTGFERISLEEWGNLPKRERARGCIHPTVKPLELIRYLATFVLPPQQEGRTRRILIPFSGSGSEVIGAIQAGWDEVVAVEMDQVYNEIADARIHANLGML